MASLIHHVHSHTQNTLPLPFRTPARQATQAVAGNQAYISHECQVFFISQT